MVKSLQMYTDQIAGGSENHWSLAVFVFVVFAVLHNHVSRRN